MRCEIRVSLYFIIIYRYKIQLLYLNLQAYRIWGKIAE